MRKYLGLLIILLAVSGCGKFKPAFPISETNPPALDGKITIKEVKVLPVPGFKTFDTDVGKYVFKFDSFSSYELLTKNGNYLLRVLNRKGELALSHNGKQIYRGQEIPDYELSPDGSHVFYYFESTGQGLVGGKKTGYIKRDYYIDSQKVGYAKKWSCVTQSQDEGCIDQVNNYINDTLVTTTKNFLSITLSAEKKPVFFEPNSIGEVCSNWNQLSQKYLKPCGYVHLVRLSEDCSSHIAITTQLKISSDNQGKTFCDEKDVIKNYWYNGKIVATEPIKSIIGLGWGAISKDGRQYYFGPDSDTKIGNSGAWVSNNSQVTNGWKINGRVVDSNNRIGDLYKVEMNDEGTAYLLSGSKGWLTSDGQYIAKKDASFAELSGNTVYHYIFENEIKK